MTPRSPCRSINMQSCPRREAPMRNAATSPARCVERKIVEEKKPNPDPIPPLAPNAPEDLELKEALNPQKVTLEKSKSLSENRPVRQLRTTRSLSPRPPIQHQKAIVVSNENDFVLHVTPTDYDDDEVFTSGNTPAVTPATMSGNCNSLQLRGKQRGKAHSEHTSPNLSCGSFFSHENRFANNRSTGCLVYVPSDPWIQLPKSTDHNQANPTSLDNDPWIQRRSADNAARNPIKQNLNNSNCQSNEKINNISSSPRPKLLRAKTPNALDNSSCCDLTSRSPLKLHPPPPAPTVSLENRSRAQHFLLNVANNPNLQPRHSFSTLLPPKDDELQLNIRRLSEQVKTTANAPHHPSIDFRRMGSPNPPPSDVMSAMTVAKQTAAFCGAVDSEPVLETTC